MTWEQDRIKELEEKLSEARLDNQEMLWRLNWVVNEFLIDPTHIHYTIEAIYNFLVNMNWYRKSKEE